MDSSVDFQRLVDRIRTQSKDAPGSDTERVTIRSFEGVGPDAMRDLLEAHEAEADDPGSLEFVLSPDNADRVLERSEETDLEVLEDRLGRTISVEEGMPADTILYADPDAFDGEELVDPARVACGLVGTETGD